VCCWRWVIASGRWASSNYYGHNAIIRVAAFAEHCRLPVLSGRPPLGGEILSHDFVEAALMRRAGYFCWQLPELRGSYEELPTNLLDYAVREPALDAGQLATCAAARAARPALDEPAAPHYGHFRLRRLADLARHAATERRAGDPAEAGGRSLFRPNPHALPDLAAPQLAEVHALLLLTLALLFGPKLLALLLRLWFDAQLSPLRR